MQEQEREDPEEDDLPEPEPGNVPEEARRHCAQCLSEPQLQTTRATFDTWLRVSQVVQADGGYLTIAVRSTYAVAIAPKLSKIGAVRKS